MREFRNISFNVCEGEIKKKTNVGGKSDESPQLCKTFHICNENTQFLIKVLHHSVNHRPRI